MANVPAKTVLFSFNMSGVRIETYKAESEIESVLVVPYHRCNAQMKVHRDENNDIYDQYIEFSVRSLDGNDIQSWVIVATDMNRDCNTVPYVIEGYMQGNDTDPYGFICNYANNFYGVLVTGV